MSTRKLKECLAIQCADGNWNWDPYMHGMANGMIFALSVIEGTSPTYLDAPDEWLCDLGDYWAEEQDQREEDDEEDDG